MAAVTRLARFSREELLPKLECEPRRPLPPPSRELRECVESPRDCSWAAAGRESTEGREPPRAEEEGPRRGEEGVVLEGPPASATRQGEEGLRVSTIDRS